MLHCKRVKVFYVKGDGWHCLIDGVQKFVGGWPSGSMESDAAVRAHRFHVSRGPTPQSGEYDVYDKYVVQVA